MLQVLELQPALLPEVDLAHVAQRHRVITVVAALSDAADQRPDPRTAVDAVDGAAALPLRPFWHGQIVQIEVIVLPVP